MIPGFSEKIKDIHAALLSHENEVWVAVTLISVAFLGYGLGRYSLIPKKPPVKIIQSPASIALSVASSTDLGNGVILTPPAGKGSSASSVTKTSSVAPSGVYYQGTRSTKKFRLSTCPGASTISEKNRVVFKTKEAALVAGYTAVKNCPGL